MKWKVAAMTLTLVLQAAAQTVPPSQGLTLDDAVRIGMAKNRGLAISSVKMQAASARSGEAHAGLLPSLKFSGGYSRLSDVPPFQVTLPIAPAPITIAPTVLNNYGARMSLQQPIFTGFTLIGNAQSAEHTAEAFQSDYLNDREDLAVNITASYWSLYQSLETKTFVDENVTRLETYRKDTENSLKAGIATRNDLLKIEVQLSNARLMQIDAANDVEVTTMNLNNMIGLPVENITRPTSAPRESTLSSQMAAPMQLTERAMTSRPDLVAMQSRVEASKAGLTAAQGGYYPQLYLTGNYYYNRPNTRYQPTLDAFKSTWDVGLQLQFDVWNWGATSSRVDQARTLVSQNQLQYDQMKDNIILDVKRNLLGVQRAADKIGVARVGVEQAEENLRTTRDKYKTGLATSTELLDADVALLQAKTNYTGALVEQEVAVARLSKSVGGEVR